MTKGILGKKVGMTQIFTESGEFIPVTVIEATPNVVLQVKTVETDGYEAACRLLCKREWLPVCYRPVMRVRYWA